MGQVVYVWLISGVTESESEWHLCRAVADEVMVIMMKRAAVSSQRVSWLTG